MVESKTLKTVNLYLFLAGVIIFLSFAQASAQNQNVSTIIVGQKNVFTEFTLHEEQLDYDPVAPPGTPWPDYMEAISENNTARVHIEATSGTAAQVIAGLGIMFEVDYGNYSPDQVLDWPVSVTFEFAYELAAYYEAGYGTAYAGLGIPNLLDGSYDTIGFLTGDTGTKGADQVIETFTTGPDNSTLILADFVNGFLSIESELGIAVYCEAYLLDNTTHTHTVHLDM